MKTAILSLLLVACASPRVTLCGGTLACPAGTTCAGGDCIVARDRCGDFADGDQCVGPVRSLCVAGACVPSTCGDGLVDPGRGEACDDGAGNSDDPGAGCRPEIRQPATCGDGIVDPEEECDDGELDSALGANACRPDCRRSRCGDGIVDLGEKPWCVGEPLAGSGVSYVLGADANADGDADTILFGDHTIATVFAGTYLEDAIQSAADFGTVDAAVVLTESKDLPPRIVVAHDGTTLDVLATDGDGRFGAPVQRLALPGAARLLAAGDADGDFVDDVVVAYGGSAGIDVLLAKAGQLQPGAHLDVGGPISGMAIADLDGDFIPDLVYGSGDDLVLVPDFDETRQIVRTTPHPIGPLVALDLDGDGRNDLVYGSPGGITIDLDTGGDIFIPSESRYALPAEVASLAIADVDRDDLPDLLVLTAGDTFLVQNTDGAVGPLSVLRLGAAGGADSVAYARVGPDCEPDLVGARRDGSFAVSSGGDGYCHGPRFAEDVVALAPAMLEGPGAIFVATFSDGVDLLDSGAGTARQVTGELLPSIASGDLDGDGVDELVGANKLGVHILKENGTGGYDDVLLLPPTTTETPSFVDVVDVDGDGHLDVVSASSTEVDVAYLRDTTAWLHDDVSLPIPPAKRFTVGRLGDGPGASVVTTDEKVIFVFRATGDRAAPFAAPPDTYAEPCATPRIARVGAETALVAYDLAQLSVITRVANTDGTLRRPSAPAPISGRSLELRVDDANGDGVNDVVALTASGVEILLGRPDGGFATHQLLSTRHAPATIVLSAGAVALGGVLGVDVRTRENP